MARIGYNARGKKTQFYVAYSAQGSTWGLLQLKT